MTLRRSLLAWAALACALVPFVACGSCDDAPAPESSPTPSDGAPHSSYRRMHNMKSLAGLLGSADGAASAEPSKPPPPDCRAMSVAGGATFDGGTLTTSAVVTDAKWLDLAKDAKVTIKHPTTGREIAIDGPGRLRACVARGEEAWLAQGGFRSSPGTGEAPGNEQWLVTPFGVVRYTAAALNVTVGEDALEVKSLGGVAFVWVGEGATSKLTRAADGGAPPPAPSADAGAPPSDGWLRVDAGSTAKVTGKRLTDEGAAAAAVTRCEKHATEAVDLARQIAAPDAGAQLGELAPKHVNARKAGRAACAVAHLRYEGLPAASAQREPLRERTLTGDARWRTLGGVKPATSAP